jgi:carboxypeptidase D
MDNKGRPPVIYVVEHLDLELGPWSALEYRCIALESVAAGARFLLTSVPESLHMPEELTDLKGLEVENRSVEEIFASSKSKVCLLDPSAAEELSPLDGEQFEVFLFGGILGMTDTPGEQMNDMKPPPNLLTVQSLHRR